MIQSNVELQLIAEVGLAAARLAAEYLRVEFTNKAAIAIKKLHTDFATNADLEAERIICTTLRAHSLQWAIVSEESYQQELCIANVTDDACWIVDPLCGTLNFYHRIPLFCVNIAFIQNGLPVVAIIADVIQDHFLVAIHGQGTTLIDCMGETRRVSTQADSSLVGIDVGERSVVGRELLQSIWSADKHLDFRIFGSSIIYAYLAQGGMTGVIHDQASVWDYVAGYLVCTEAGAVITDGEGQPWRIDSKTMIAAASAKRHNYLLKIYKQTPIFHTRESLPVQYATGSDAGIHVAGEAKES